MILASSGLVFWKSAKTAWRSPWLSASTSQSAGSEIVTSPDWCSVQPSGVGAAGTAVGVGVAGTTVGVAGVDGVGAGQPVSSRAVISATPRISVRVHRVFIGAPSVEYPDESPCSPCLRGAIYPSKPIFLCRSITLSASPMPISMVQSELPP